MALFPVAPRIRARLPRVLHAGQSFVAEILIDAREPVRLDWLEAQLECVATWSIGSGNSAHGSRDTLVTLRARLLEAGVLPAGEHVYPVRFELPPTLPPSCDVASAKIETLLSVHASIPWWPDARATFVVPVRAAPRALDVEPYRATNQAKGTDIPRVELSLASRVVSARGTITGALAIFHHDPRVAESVSLSLRGVIRLAEGGGRVHVANEAGWGIPLPGVLPADGTPIPFRVAVPPGLVPSFASRSITLEWRLVVERRGMLRSDTWLSVPIEVREPGDGGADPGALDVPAIGDPRLAEELARAAVAVGLAVDGAALVGSTGAVQLRIARAQRADVGHVLVAELAFPRLGLGLTIERARWLARLLASAVASEDDALVGTSYRLEARDREQAELYVAHLAASLRDHTLVRLDDRSARLEQPDATLDAGSLGAFARHARDVASLIDASLAAVPFPRAIEVDGDAWMEVARALHGRFVAGDLSIDAGRAGESSVAIETRVAPRDVLPASWELPVRAEHVVRVRPVPELPPDLALTVVRPRAESTGLTATRGRALAGFLAACPEEARDLMIRAGEVSVRLPLPTVGDHARSDPRGALSLATLLAGLGARLAPARGPFR